MQTPRTGPNRAAKWQKWSKVHLHIYLLEWASPEALWGGAGIFVPPSMVNQKEMAQLGLWKAQITSRWNVCTNLWQLTTAQPGSPTWQGPSQGLSPGGPPCKRRARGLIARQSGQQYIAPLCAGMGLPRSTPVAGLASLYLNLWSPEWERPDRAWAGPDKCYCRYGCLRDVLQISRRCIHV